MSTNLNYKQVANVERRTWDVEAYEKKAQQRQKEMEEEAANEGGHQHKRKQTTSAVAAAAAGLPGGESTSKHEESEEDKEEFRPAMAGAAGPEGSDRAFLKARSAKVSDIDSRVGRVEMVSVEAATTHKTTDTKSADDIKQGVVKTGIGWHCKVCDCFLKDSHTYLDHINGRKHQRKLGFSMRVERSTKDDIKSRLESLAKKKEESMDPNMQGDNEETDFDDLVRVKDEELRRKREERKKRRKERKQQKLQQQGTEDGKQEESATQEEEPTKAIQNDRAEGEDEGETDEAQIDPNLAAMMGFDGFGGSNRN